MIRFIHSLTCLMACVSACLLFVASAVADTMSFPPGSFDINNPNYIGEHVVLAGQVDGFFPGGSVASGYTGIAYGLGEPIETTTFGLNLADAQTTGFPDNLTSFESEADLSFTPGDMGLASEFTLDHGQIGELSADDTDESSRNFLSTLASQVVGESFALGGSPTFELLVTIDSLLQQAGLTAASEGLSIKVIEFLEDGGAEEILGVSGFYFIDGDGSESVSYTMTDGSGGSTDISNSFTFTPDGAGGSGSANFSYAMNFQVPVGRSFGVLFLSDIGVDTFGEGTVSLSTRFTTSVSLRAVTPGAGILVNDTTLIPEPTTGLLIATGAVAALVRRR
ncbi:MAG: PEP-CTERM sorting domain-containing protein [Planctomycetota bacterium]